MDNAPLFSLKMRAAAGKKHISGAEKLLPEKAVPQFAGALLERALHHANGRPDFINLKLEAVSPDAVLTLPALPVRTVDVPDAAAGRREMTELLASCGVKRAAEIVELLYSTHGMRGAILLDAETLAHLEPDPERGVRATYMDDADSSLKGAASCKDHYAEAIVLATKVAHAPGIVAELCISDDPDYVTGYIASRELGYVRITRLKEAGVPRGGRIFLYRGASVDAAETIDFLEHRCVAVTGVTPLAVKRFDKTGFVADGVKKLHGESLFRNETVFASAAGPRTIVDGREVLMLASNDYLDLARDGRVVAAAAEALKRYGLGTGGSRLTTGTTALHRELEDALARFKGTESALVFNTGFAANSGIIPALCPAGGTIFSDELNHASIIDGCRAAKARTVIYRHNDVGDLERKIRAANPRAGGVIVSDAVFSMDGDVAHLPEILVLAEEFGLFSMIDEAHSTGVLGKSGHGICEHFGAERKPDVLMGTLSKALGAEGGFVCCTAAMRDYLRHKCRSFVFSTSLPAAVMAGALAALRIIVEGPQRTEDLRANVEFFLAELAKHGIDARTESAIVPVLIGDEGRAAAVAKELLARGVFASAIRYPTVARGEARLRFALMATHTRNDLERAARETAAAIKKYGITSTNRRTE